MKDLLAKLDYITSEADQIGQSPRFGGDPENDLTPATVYAVGQVLQMVAQLADITRAALNLLTPDDHETDIEVPSGGPDG